MWIPNEVRLAIQNCYKDRDIMEVYEYEETNYDPHTREEWIFAEYINTFFKRKPEASGYPSWVRNPEDQERYDKNFYARKGVRLDRDAIKPDAA